MGVLVHSFTLLVANYFVKKSLLLFEATHARDNFSLIINVLNLKMLILLQTLQATKHVWIGL